MRPRVIALGGALALAGLGWVAGSAFAHSRDPVSAPVAALSQNAPLPADAPPGSAPAPWGADRAAAVERAILSGNATSSATVVYLELYEAVQSLDSAGLLEAIGVAVQSRERWAATSVSAIATYWAERDLPAARRWFENLPPNQRTEYAPEFVDAWSRLDPRGALDWLEKLPEAQREKLAGKLFTTVAATAGKVEPERAMRLLLAAGTPGESVGAFKELFSAWAAKSSAAAAQQALALPAGEARSAAIEATAAAWARLDPAAARAWVEAFPDPVVAARAQAAYAAGLARTDPRAAADYAGSLTATNTNLRTMETIAAAWVRRDPAAALGWVDGIDDADARRRLFRGMLDTLSAVDPAQAERAYVARAAEFEEDRFAALPTLARNLLTSRGVEGVVAFAAALPEAQRIVALGAGLDQWAEDQPDAAAAWALRQPEGPARQVGLAQVARAKASDDPAAALAWVKTLPATPSSDPAVASTAMSLFRRDPDAGAVLLQRLTDQNVAQTVLTNYAGYWLRRDRAAAEAWLARSPLPAAVRARLLEQANALEP